MHHALFESCARSAPDWSKARKEQEPTGFSWGAPALELETGTHQILAVQSYLQLPVSDILMFFEGASD